MRLISITFLLGALCFATFAQASTISVLQTNGTLLNVTVSARAPDAWTFVDQSKSSELPTGSSWQEGSAIWQLPSTSFPIDLGTDPTPLDPCRNACSPFYGGIYDKPPFSSTGAAGWETASFWTIFAPDAASSEEVNQALLDFGGTSRSSFSLLWGSADRTNLLEFLLEGETVGSFWGAQFEAFGEPNIVMDPGQGAVLASFRGIEFDAVRFTAYRGGGSFEFSNALVPIPLPAGMVLILTGLAALAAVGRVRNARDAHESI
jgi:hypothetical protein